jgi:hypothetical protein
VQGLPKKTMSRSMPTRRFFLRGDKRVFKGTDAGSKGRIT